MDEDERALKVNADAFGSKLSLTLPEDPIAAADLIVTRRKEQDALRQQRLALAPELKEAETETKAHKGKHAEAAEKLANLIKLASVDDETALIARSRRCKARAELAEARIRTENSLSAISDGLEPKVLIEQVTGRDLDAIVERYVELSVARDLISEAIDRVRSEQQDPLIKRASQLFSHATLGRFSGIECDLDDKGQPVVVGKRASGGDVPVSAMSDGTRDQMFLAFRLASLEQYANSAETLPFVADDILVHFDDERSRATLDLLATFGKTNQVLLFTHHQSVRELARPFVEQGLASVLELAPA
jgi:DNA repair exonuclease SbcCD ATPase subunit